MKRFARGALTLAFWLTVWAALALLVHRELLLPAPWAVVRRLCELAATGTFWRITAVSIGRVLLGVLGAVVLGVATAVACTASKTADALLRPLMTVVKSTPVASFVVLALIWIARDWLPVFIALLMVLPVVWSNVCTGIRSADPALLELARAILGFFIKPLKKLFPPIVTSLVIISIGLSLLPVGIKYFGGGAGAKDFGSLNHLLVGTTVIIVILVLKQFKGFLNDSSILIGIIVGYILAICLGMVDFTQVKESAWFSLPHPMVVPFEFNIQAIIAMGIMFIATTVETIGDISGITNGGLDREPTNRELSGGVMADGIGSIVASIFGVLPNTSFSQNVGLVTVTKIVNRFVIMTGAIFLILCGFCPKLSAIFSVMPQSVLGGAAVIMFSMILVSGLQSLSRETLDGRNGLIVALAIGIGVGIGNVPEVLAQCPEWAGGRRGHRGRSR